ncbi:MltA domain-containing protein [Oscillatoria sp. FACHB-1406]|uniref:murein transglycosylase A n=1 Tax=Oscillatoria sp. FACHB-1406 TaxID=2692846 RepID=UPI001683D008|nr:MltA domain-containing protein [Oscillatoria sp. FACHB-1406]MBD2576552.1 MltA domain-containing protein [Oscillatoria sp. FACHB-1406]
MKRALVAIPLSLVATGAMLYGVTRLIEFAIQGRPLRPPALLQSPLVKPPRAIALSPPHWNVNDKKLLPLYPIDGERAGGGSPALGLDDRLWADNGDKETLLRTIDGNLNYLASDAAAIAYRKYPIKEITQARLIRSLQRFRELLLAARSPEELQAAVKREFVFYQAVGIGPPRQGEVLFTAYFEPIYEASRTRTPEYRYPLYSAPPDLDRWPRPHPSRAELEGKDGLQTHPKLKGLQLFWLRDRWEAYTIHIQGSARLKLTDGTETSVGYAGNVRQEYTSVGKALVEDRKLTLEQATMPGILAYFEQYPQEMNVYLPRDRSFVFFREKRGQPASGSLGLPLTLDRSVATDKSVMPPGALALLYAPLPLVINGKVEERIVSRYVLDRDTGGAIKGPGRVDYFAGSGKAAGARAGVTRHIGQFYYLLLKEAPAPITPNVSPASPSGL